MVALPSDARGADHWFIQGPGWQNVDLSVRKIFRVREGWTLRFTADSFNA
jgi:hypothetical protein